MQSPDKQGDAFSGCHPIITFLYFAAVLLISMFLTHPILLGISFLGAMAYAIVLKGWRKVLKFNLLLTLPSMVVIAFMNPAFNHYGVTFLFYLKTGPVTLEAIVYGLVLASMLFIAILWFSCYNEVMTTDKFVYLFGRLVPAMSLVLSMAFRFVPRFGAQLQVIRNGQKAIGRDVSNGNIFRRIRYGIRILSILITWALENAIETSDSMSARGYGLKGRTAFSIFRFDLRDKCVSLVLLGLISTCFLGFSHGVASAVYNPFIRIGGLEWTPVVVVTYAAWAVFCFFPVFLHAHEAWKFGQLAQMATMERNLPWYLVDQESGRQSACQMAGKCLSVGMPESKKRAPGSGNAQKHRLTKGFRNKNELC